MKIAIIGAGPAGLYTAIKLRKAGIIDLVVYDPREGHYTRPGELREDAFAVAGVELNRVSWYTDNSMHIKDLERALYKEAKNLGIPIEKKRFVRIHQDEQRPGVIVTSDGIEELVEANYIFDCTGVRRAVVNAVNLLDPNSIFTSTSMTDLPVKNHFLAYIKVKKEDSRKFNEVFETVYERPNSIDPVTYSQSIVKLRALGWTEFKIPRCYSHGFGKDKRCFYMHAPDHLKPEDYPKWVETVLQCYVPDMSYTHLDSSIKPRFQAFQTSAHALEEFSYKGKSMPTIIALGDAQIDYDYALAHGIHDGIIRINALFNHLRVENGEISDFDSEHYNQEVINLLMDHKKGIISEAEKLRLSFTLALDVAESKFKEALEHHSESIDKEEINKLLEEVALRQKSKKNRTIYCRSSI